MNVLRILSGIILVVDIVIIIFLYTTIIFDDFENEFNKKLIKII